MSHIHWYCYCYAHASSERRRRSSALWKRYNYTSSRHLKWVFGWERPGTQHALARIKCGSGVRACSRSAEYIHLAYRINVVIIVAILGLSQLLRRFLSSALTAHTHTQSEFGRIDTTCARADAGSSSRVACRVCVCVWLTSPFVHYAAARYSQLPHDGVHTYNKSRACCRERNFGRDRHHHHHHQPNTHYNASAQTAVSGTRSQANPGPVHRSG